MLNSKFGKYTIFGEFIPYKRDNIVENFQGPPPSQYFEDIIKNTFKDKQLPQNLGVQFLDKIDNSGMQDALYDALYDPEYQPTEDLKNKLGQILKELIPSINLENKEIGEIMLTSIHGNNVDHGHSNAPPPPEYFEEIIKNTLF